MVQVKASEPVLQEVLGGYRLHWVEGAEEALIVEVKHVKDDHDTMTAELTIWTDYMNDTRPVLSAIRLNMLAPRSRKELATRLNDLKPTFPWAGIIEQTCQDVIERHRTGDPGSVIQPVDDDEMVVPQYFLEPLVLAAVPNAIYGDKGVAKTTMGLLAAGCLNGPWVDNPFGFATNGHHHETAVLDWESNKELTLYATQRLRRGSNIPYFELAYRHCKVPLPDDIEQIGQFINKRKCDFAIVDSIGAACGGDLFKPDIAIRFFEALRTIPAADGGPMTWLLIGQNSKGEEGKKSLFGSVYFTYYCRNIFELKKFGDFDEKTESYVALIHQEANYSGKHDPMGFHLSYTKQSIAIEPAHVTSAQLVEKAQVQQKLTAILREANIDMSLHDLAIATGTKEATLSVILNKMKGRGQVVNRSRGTWGLVRES